MQWPAIRFHLHLKGIGREDDSGLENVQNVQNVQFVPHTDFICLLYQTSFVWFLLLLFLIDDRLYSAILRSLEQTHCARM